MSSVLPLISSFFLSILFISFISPKVHGGGDQSFYVVNISSLLPADICSTPKGSNNNSLRISHRHGPCSPLAGNQKFDHLDLLNQDKLRVDSLHQRLHSLSPPPHNASRRLGVSKTTTLPTQRGNSKLDTGNYVITIGLGTPTKYQTVVFDTGSSTCWVQCYPCATANSCYPQHDPLFDPSLSTSYKRVACTERACLLVDVQACSKVDGSCVYGAGYGDNSTTFGYLSRDTLTLSPADVFQNFVFGCGKINHGLFGKTAGLFGLGRHPLSVVSQTSAKFGNLFSYCLPASDSYNGYLTFGVASAASVLYTPMKTYSRDPSLYALDLVGISVGGQLLPISISVFSTAGTIIDSGTVISRLPPAAYEALRSAFRNGMAGYTLLGKPLSILDTCYVVAGRTAITVPAVALHFGGGLKVKLDGTRILYVFHNSIACLAFAPTKSAVDVGIIGNAQQRGLEIVYDLGMKRIGFGVGTC